MVFCVQAPIRGAEKDLRAQLKVVADLMEYAYHQGINRANRDAHQFIKTLPGPITVEAKTIKTGPTELPIVRVDGKIVNGDTTLLDRFHDMVGTEPAFLMRYNGELYRVASLLKDKDGKPTHGTIIPKGDAQERAYASGVETSTMVERNGRIFSSHLVPVIGFSPLMIATQQGISLVYQFWIHTETIGRLPAPIEAVFNTPSTTACTTPATRLPRPQLRRHIDHLGSAVRHFRAGAGRRPCRYGVVKNLGDFNLLRVAFHEWIAIGADLLRARSPLEALGYVFGPPGWSPDGSRETSAEIKRKWRERGGGRG